LKRWASLGIFVAAATPVPDDPIVVPLGLTHYSSTRLFLAYFSGKLLIGSVGAYLGKIGSEYGSAYLTLEGIIVISMILTLALTIILLKTDTGKLLEKATSSARFAEKQLG